VIVIGLLWRNASFSVPEPEDLTPVEALRRYVRYVALALLGGVLAGIPVMGCGGRLAMRLLAVTAGDRAQGRITEADEVVGDISVGGTFSFVLFIGILIGVATAAGYLVVRRVWPSGWLGGALYGLGLLVVFGATTDPLRRDNRDFDIVGPGWLAVLVFALLAVVYGGTLAAVIGRLSAWLPLPSRDRSSLRYIAPGLLAVPGLSVTAAAVGFSGVVVLATRVPPIVAFVRSARFVLAARVAVALVVAIRAPEALASFSDIATR
jgi:hypothetical protein